ncbi:hypothetical protein [Nonlabens sp.]|uniref:hypothetical protein n=1 Tax=Nonlabens sp. TaxID=1888209 RepID=UPI003F69BAAE
MKNLITIALLCLLTSAYSQEEISGNNIDTNLTFGKYTDCFRPGGICTFNKNTKEKTANSQSVFNKDQTLTIYIHRDQITPVEEFKILGEELHEETNLEELTFLMEEELEIPEEARLALKLPEYLTTIAVGEYPIKVTEKEFIITLKLE